MNAIDNDIYTTHEIPDSIVVARIMQGEKELFEILLRRYNQTLYRTIRSYVSSEDDVEDIMQEAYIKAFRKLNQFHENSQFSTWLIRIGINEALQHIRKKKRTPGGNEKKEILDGIVQLPDTHQMNPEKQAMNHEFRSLVEKAIDNLPEKYRIIIVLHEAEGLAHSEIATCLDLSDSNVKVRLHRARNLLKEEMYKLSSDASVFEFGFSRCDRITAYVMGKI